MQQPNWGQYSTVRTKPMSSIPSSVQPASTAKITAEAAQQQIATHVRQAAKFIRALDIMVLMSGWLVLILATWLVGSVIDHWLVALPIVARWSIWLAVVALSTWFAATRLTPLLVRRINPTYAAQRIEQIVPEFKNGLIAWFELQSMPDHGVPKGVMAALSYRAMRFIGGYDPSSTIDSGPLIKRAGLIVLLVIGLAVYGALSHKSILESGMRLAMPWLNTAAPTRVQILEVSPGATELTYGIPLDVTADLRGLRNNEPVMVCYNTLDGQFSNIRTPLTASIEGFQFKGAVKTGTNGVEHDMEYWIEAGDAVSRKYRVTLSPLPSLAVDRVRVEFPKYTRLQPREFSPTVDIEAVEGSKMEVWGSSNQQLSRARLVTNAQLNEAGQIYQAGEYLEMTVDGQTVQGSCWLFPSKQSFCLSGANVRGDSNIYPVSRPLKVSADLPPEIELVGPEDRVVKVAPTSRLTLEIRASDPDYGLTKVVLDLRQNQIPSTTRVLLEGADEGKDPTLARVFPVPFNLAALKASPGDRIEITATAFDNRHDPNSKALSPNQTKSIPLILEVVAPAEAKVPPELQRKEPEKHQPSSKDPNKQSEQPKKDPTSSDKQDGSENGSSQNGDSKSGSESGNSESPANNNPNGSQDDKSSANDSSNSNNGKESGSQESSSSNSGNNDSGSNGSGSNDSGNSESSSNESGKKESGSKESNSGESGKKSSGGNKAGNQASDKQESGKQESGNQNSGDQNGSSKESSSSPENSSKQGGKQGGQKSSSQPGNSKSADSANGDSSRNGSKQNSSNDKSKSGSANGDPSTSNSNDLSDASQSNDPSEARQRDSDKRAADRVKEFMEKQKSSDKGSHQGSKDGTPEGSKDGTNADNARNNDSQKGSDQKGSEQKGESQKGQQPKGEQQKGAGQESSGNQPKGDSGSSGDDKQSDAKGSKPAGEDSKGSKDPSKSGQPADNSKPENKSADGKQEGKPDGKSEGSQPKSDSGNENKQGAGGEPNKDSQSKSGNSDSSQKGNDQNSKSDQAGNNSDQSGSKSDQSSKSPGQSQSEDSSKGESGKDERMQREGGEGESGQGEDGQAGKSGDKQDANSKSDGSSKSQGSGSQGNDSKGSDSKGSDSKGSQSKGSDSQGSDSKGGDSKGSDSKGSDSKGGDSKQGGDAKSGQSGEGSKSKPQQGDSKQGDSKQADGKQGDSKSGQSGESSKQGSKSGQQGSDSKSSESQSSGSKSSGSEGSESGSQGSEGSPSGGSKPSGQGSGKPSDGKEASQGGGGATSGGAGGTPGATEASNPNDAKKATDLVLDYLKRQRQQPDPELLKEMNWTEQDLRNFVDRYQRARDLTANAEALENSSSELSRLRGDGNNASVGASGAADAFRNQIDAGGPQRPPENLRKRVEAFQEALKKSQK